MAVSQNLRKWALTPPPFPTLLRPSSSFFLYFSGLLLSCISFGLHALAVSLLCSPFCISHRHLIHLTCSPQLSASFSSSTAPPSVSAPEQYFLHNHCWWGFHFEHLLISHFFSFPSLIKAVRFYWCQLCLHINDLFVCPPQQVWLIEQDFFFFEVASTVTPFLSPCHPILTKTQVVGIATCVGYVRLNVCDMNL